MEDDNGEDEIISDNEEDSTNREENNKDSSDIDTSEAENDGSDTDMFAEDERVDRTEKDFVIKKVMEQTDDELFVREMDENIPGFVRKSRKYIKRKNKFIQKYIEEKDFQNSQEILQSYSQNPKVVTNSKSLKRKLEHLTHEERATKLILQSVNNSITRIRETPGREAKNQELVAVALVTHHRWGTPELEADISWRTKKKAKEMKIKLLTGEDNILVLAPIKWRKVFPEEIEEFALTHWNESTIPEPSVHRRMKPKDKSSKDKENPEEIIPTRWQHLSQREQYANFKEEYGNKVGEVMRKKAEEKTSKLQNRPESDDKQKRQEFYANMHTKFPSDDWYLSLRPKEVKMLNDHTTGLCKVCESASLNYLTLLKNLKRMCACTSSKCPNWECFCDEEIEDNVSCICKCACDSCLNCKVCITLYH